jgi:hypothetical protein
MARRLGNWLTGYLELVKDTEPHTRFHMWVGLMLVAATLGRKVQLQLGPELIFPNLYIILVGPAASGKSTAIRYGADLLRKAGTVIMAPAGRVTDQQLYIELEDAGRVVKWPDGTTFQHHTMLVIASELVMFLGETKGSSKRASTDRLADMCELYDGGPFSYRTKNQGINSISNPGFFLLGATTPLWITTSMPTLAMAGGPTSRTLFVHSSTKGRVISLADMPAFSIPLQTKLIHDLQQVAKMVGEFTLTDDAKQFYTTWYLNVHPYIDLKDQRLDTYLGRMPIMLVKTAMALSACRDDSMIVTQQDMEGALRLINNANKHMSKAFGYQGHNIMGPQTELMRELLDKHGQLTQAEILSSLRMHLNKRDYDFIRDTLIAEGYVEMLVDGAGNQVLRKK